MKFSDEQYDFIRNVLKINCLKEEKDEDILQEIQDKAFEIEYDECCRLEELTPKGETATEIVTEIGKLWE